MAYTKPPSGCPTSIAPQQPQLSGRGESALGFGEGQALVSLTALSKTHTQLHYRYGADVGGKLAAFGQRMIEGVVRVLLASILRAARRRICAAMRRSQGFGPAGAASSTCCGWCGANDEARTVRLSSP